MGVYAAWIALTLATALHGTPYGYGVLGGDAGRFVAMAMKYMWTWQSADSFARDLPTEYPPLYPWIIGHVATLVDRPAWQLFGEAQIVVMSGALVVAYLMWRRLVGPAVAFTIVGLSPAVFNQPSKDYEFLALLVFAPWVLATFAGIAACPRRDALAPRRTDRRAPGAHLPGVAALLGARPPGADRPHPPRYESTAAVLAAPPRGGRDGVRRRLVVRRPIRHDAGHAGRPAGERLLDVAVHRGPAPGAAVHAGDPHSGRRARRPPRHDLVSPDYLVGTAPPARRGGQLRVPHPLPAQDDCRTTTRDTCSTPRRSSA